MTDTVHHVMWYTVYDAKSGDLIASGTSEMCARRLGYKSANSFASASCHSRNGRRRARKYIFEKECIRRGELDSLPPIRRKKKEEPARAPTRTSQKGDEFRRPSPQRYHKQEVFTMDDVAFYYCYGHRKEYCSIDVQCFEGEPVKASVDAQHWADEQIQTGEYIQIDVKDALGNLIYSR